MSKALSLENEFNDDLRKIPGPQSQEIFFEEQGYLAPGIQSISTLSRLVFEMGDGAYLKDVDGQIYIDFVAGICVSSLGHSQQRYVHDVKEQLSKIIVGSYASKSRLAFLKNFKKISPITNSRLQFYSGGTEAVEAAMRLAKSATNKWEFIGFWGGFHGKSLGSLGVMGSSFKNDFGPLAPGYHLVPYANCSRCPFEKKYPECKIFCADYVNEFIKNNTTGNLAAIIMEPIQGTAGNIIPPIEFVRQIREIAKKHNALFIADEMITGFARTGKWFGVNHYDITPDIVTIGKGMGSGFPVSGIVASEDIINSEPFSMPSGSSSSYGGNPLALTAANATLKIMLEENILDNVNRCGEIMLARLKTFENKYPFIFNARGKGLLLGFDLVEDKNSKELLTKEKCKIIFYEALKRGLLTMTYNPNVRINPPLTITEKTVTRALDILEDTFTFFYKHHY